VVDDLGTATTRKPRSPAGARARVQSSLYTLIPSVPADPSVAERVPLTVRCDRDLAVGNQIWVQSECWEVVSRQAALDDAPERAVFLCATSPPPRARILAGSHESWLYEPDLLELGRAVRGLHADQTPATRTIQAAVRAALDGDDAVEANLEGDALRVIAKAIRGLEISGSLSPALKDLCRKLNQHFDDLKRAS
jgi:hypothetical protein